MQTYLFVNPGSGNYAPKRVDDLVASLTAAGLAPILHPVRTPASVIDCCRSINSSADQPLVIVAAGDGTFNAVLNGLRPASATLAILPLGTSNVLAAELGISSVEEGVRRISAGRTRPLSAGLIELENGSYRFALMAGCGFDGSVVRGVRPREKRLLKQGAFALSALRHSLAWDAETFEVVTPAATIACHTVIACNASRYAGNFRLAPDADPCSPGFSVACMRSSRRGSYLRLAWDLFLGKIAANRDLLQIHASSLEIRGRMPIQLDGDFVGYGPARLSSLPDFARLIV